MPHYLLLLHRLQNLDDAFLIIVHIDALKHFAVLAATNFPNDFIVVLVSVQQAEVTSLLELLKTNLKQQPMLLAPTAQKESRSPSSLSVW